MTLEVSMRKYGNSVKALELVHNYVRDEERSYRYCANYRIPEVACNFEK